MDYDPVRANHLRTAVALYGRFLGVKWSQVQILSARRIKCRYSDGKGLVDNDLLASLRGGRNPVAAHLFINHMLDPQVATANFTATGYQPPQVSLGPDSAVVDRLVPKRLRTAVVQPDYFDVGYRIVALDPANDAAWHDIWREFKTRRD